MAIVYDKLMNLKIPDAEQSYTEKDSILYALGLGFGLDPNETDQLPFIFEKEHRVVPTMGVVLAHPGFWVRDLDTGIDWVQVVHGEQGLTLHKPLPPRGTVVGKNRVVDVIDKGAGRGAIVLSERTLFDKATGDLLATVNQTTFCRGDGGFGGPERAQPLPHNVPERPADLFCDLSTSPQAALIYRLSGDYNPLHADPAVARAAGFPRPILHGLATFGVAAHAILKAVCNYRSEEILSIQGRFTAPVYPGETFRTKIWRDGSVISFQVHGLDRKVTAISNGRVELRK